MGIGVEFAGNGGNDVSINKESTSPPSTGMKGPNVVEFAGNGGNDVSGSLGTNTPKGGPSGSGVQFAGNGDKDV